MTTCEACHISYTDGDWLKENLKAHAFPMKKWQTAYLKSWLIFCHLPVDTTDLVDKFLCSRHFSIEDYTSGDDRELKSEAIPHLCPPSVFLQLNEYPNWSDYNYDLGNYQLMEGHFEDNDVMKKKQVLENVKNILCRLCGKTKSSLYPIYELLSTHEEKQITVIGLIQAHLPVKISRNDILPLNVCDECLTLLQQWHAMYTTCQAAELALQKIFCQSEWIESEEKSETLDCREELPDDAQVDIVREDFEIKVKSESEAKENLTNENQDEPQQSLLPSNVNASSHAVNFSATKIILNKKKKQRVQGYKGILKRKQAPSSKKQTGNEGSKQTYKCNHCRQTFETLFKKKQHISQCREIPSVCEKCGKVVSRRKNMGLHQKQHKFELICDICGVCCGSSASFETHQVKVHNKEPSSVFCCQLCCRVYYSLNQYTTHVKVHDAGKIKQMFNYELFQSVGCTSEYVCVFCESEFNNKISLIVHLNAPKKLKCSTCQEEFSNERGLVIHNGRKMFCRYCKKAFCVAHMMRAHERTHTKEKPYNCKYCSASFRTANQRDSHQTIHGPPMFECSFCQKKFRYRAGFQDHLNYHLGNLVTCKLCNRRYGGNLSLMRHVRRYHNRANTCNGRLSVTENSHNKLAT